MALIESVHGREIIDSRGNPTVEVEIVDADGNFGRAAVPSGASTGQAEALELRDADPNRYGGWGVLRAVGNVNGPIADALTGVDVVEQALIDTILLDLDGTPNKRRLGANALLGASLAAAHCAAAAVGLPLYRYLGGTQGRILPVPQLNVINGGAHANNPLEIQEFMLAPAGFGSFSRALQAGTDCFHCLRNLLNERGFSTAVGDEGGFAPAVTDARQALDLLMRAIERAGYRPGEQIYLALDVAANELASDGTGPYDIPSEEIVDAGVDVIVDFYQGLMDDYPLVSIEDGLGEEDWNGWQVMTAELGSRIQLVGDDLFVTNEKRLKRGLAADVANAILIKPNQIGTLTETLNTVGLAQNAGYAVVISHRSGETSDTTIADLAVATGCGQLKSGAMSRIERVEKYNQLLRIEDQLGSTARFAGRAAFASLRKGIKA